MTKSLLDLTIEMEFLVSDETYIFPHYACIYVQQMLIVKVITENVAKVQKLWY